MWFEFCHPLSSSRGEPWLFQGNQSNPMFTLPQWYFLGWLSHPDRNKSTHGSRLQGLDLKLVSISRRRNWLESNLELFWWLQENKRCKWGRIYPAVPYSSRMKPAHQEVQSLGDQSQGNRVWTLIKSCLKFVLLGSQVHKLINSLDWFLFLLFATKKHHSIIRGYIASAILVYFHKNNNGILSWVRNFGICFQEFTCFFINTYSGWCTAVHSFVIILASKRNCDTEKLSTFLQFNPIIM